MTREDWLAWKADPVTQAFFEACEERIEEAKDILSVSAGMDGDQDNLMRGFIKAYREMMEFEVND